METKQFNEWCKSEVHPSFWVMHTYPLTIVADRYGGAYSRGEFLAFPVDECQVPWGYGGSDGQCMDFWNEVDSSYIGIGDTPNEALDNLKDKLRAKIDAKK